MRSVLILASLALALPAVSPAHAADPVVVYERTFAEAFVGAEAAYVVVPVPDGYHDLRFRLDCGLVGGGIVLYGAMSGDARALRCFDDVGLQPDPTDRASGWTYYYGVASFAGANGARLTVTGVPP